MLKILIFSRKLFGCLQTPFLEMRNMIKPPPSPLHYAAAGGGEGESLSEWFCHVNNESTPNHPHHRSECSSVTVPFADLSISYMDDHSSASDASSTIYFEDKDDHDDTVSRVNCNSIRGMPIFI